LPRSPSRRTDERSIGGTTDTKLKVIKLYD
jgi:hypothetical protein